MKHTNEPTVLDDVQGFYRQPFWDMVALNIMRGGQLYYAGGPNTPETVGTMLK